jgi:prepilin-type N-terminal cleavage/methylation domain-containing protein
MKTSSIKPCGRTSRGVAFTLIELLVVIAIIGIIASMVVGLSGLAARKKHDAVVTAMKNRLVLFIYSYQSKMGFFPPDNITNVLALPGTPLYEQSTGQNPLLYELTGAPVVGNTSSFLAFDSNVIAGSTFNAAYGRGGIANSLPDETHVFYQPLPGPKDYMVAANGLKQLVVPASLTGAPGEINAWHYDSSSTNRHNSATFDLWAEYSAGGTGTNAIIITNGNWNLQ